MPITLLLLPIAGFLGPFTGWLIDRIGPKKIYLTGIVFLAVAYLACGLFPTREVTLLAMVAYWVGFNTNSQSCATICGICLVNRDRATGMMICETVAAGLLGMAGPMLASGLVTLSGGVNVAGIRPLFFFAFVGIDLFIRLPLLISIPETLHSNIQIKNI